MFNDIRVYFLNFWKRYQSVKCMDSSNSHIIMVKTCEEIVWKMKSRFIEIFGFQFTLKSECRKNFSKSRMVMTVTQWKNPYAIHGVQRTSFSWVSRMMRREEFRVFLTSSYQSTLIKYLRTKLIRFYFRYGSEIMCINPQATEVDIYVGHWHASILITARHSIDPL